MKKRKQHYVWEHYLKAWATNGRVWCLQGGRHFCTNTDNLANERDFYRLEEMSHVDLAFVERIAIEPLSPDLQKMARGWIAPFNELFVMRRQYEARGEKLPEFEDLLDVAINNFEEDMHAEIETSAVTFLADLRDERAAFLDDEANFILFARFIAAQYMRTPAIMNRALDAVGDMFPGFNMGAAWGLLRTIYATNIGFALFRRRTSLCITFLDAGSTTPFITGDQPMVNVRAAGTPSGSVPTEFELFYPLSPRLGVLLDFDGPERATVRRQLSDAETAKFNGMIAERSVKQLYGASKQALRTDGDTSAHPA